jgi:hypothetical protein
LAFASTFVPAFILLEIHGQEFCFLLDMNVFINGPSSSTREGSAFLCRGYVCCTAVSARAYPRCQGIQVTLCTLCNWIILTFMEGIRKFSVIAGLCSRLCLNLCNYSEIAICQLNGRKPDRRIIREHSKMSN